MLLFVFGFFVGRCAVDVAGCVVFDMCCIAVAGIIVDRVVLLGCLF